jgi:hypothetical protein
LNWAGLIAFFIGSFIGGLIFIPFLAVIAYFIPWPKGGPDQRAGCFLVVPLVIISIAAIRGFDPVTALATIPPFIAVWWFYRRILRNRATRASS